MTDNTKLKILTALIVIPILVILAIVLREPSKEEPSQIIQEETKFGSGSVAYSATSNSGAQSITSGYSWDHTCGASDTALIVAVSSGAYDAEVVVCTGVTYDSVAMTKIDSQSWTESTTRGESSLWRLENPTTGSAKAVEVTLAGESTYSAGGAISVTGSDTTNCVKQSNKDSGESKLATVDLDNTVSGNLVIDSMSGYEDLPTVGANQTERVNLDLGFWASLGMSQEDGNDGTVTMSWSWGANDYGWAIVAAEIQVPTEAPAPSENRAEIIIFD